MIERNLSFHAEHRGDPSSAGVWRSLALVFGVALVARVLAASVTPIAFFPDSVRFRLAVQVLRHGGDSWLEGLGDWTAPLPVFLWAPFIHPGVGVERAIWLQHFLGCVTAVLMFVATRVLHGARVALVVSLAFALCPYLLFAERAFLGEAIHLFTVALVLAAFVFCARSRRPGIWAPLLGLALALAVLTKSNSEALVGGLALGLLLPALPNRQGRPNLGPRLAAVGLALATCGAIALPWLLHQQRAFGVLQVTPNTRRNQLLYALEAGLFDAHSDLGPNPLLRDALPDVYQRGPLALQGQPIIGDLTQLYGAGEPSERRAGQILTAEVRRKPLEFAQLVGDTASFLFLERGRGNDELRGLLRIQWAGLPPPAGFPRPRGPVRWESPALLNLLWRADAISFPGVRLLPVLALVGLVAAAVRGGANRRWAAQLAPAFLLVMTAHSLALASNFRFLAPFFPLFALCAVSWMPLRRD